MPFVLMLLPQQVQNVGDTWDSPLVAEGYKLGTLCITSSTARPHGLSLNEQEMLHDSASMTVSTVVVCRIRRVKDEYKSNIFFLARTFFDTSQSLEEAKDNVEKIKAHISWGVGLDEYERLNATAHILEIQTKMRSTAMMP
jgi:hypothetical protein